MVLSLSQLIGVAFVGVLIIGALAFLWFTNRRISYLFRKPLRQAISAAIVILIIQTVFILLANTSA
jgi:hypothetical protein